jgi:hypothetical protein
MELDYALLADAAQVSEGKTFVLGGGVSILWRTQYPASLGISLVSQFTIDRSEAGTEHTVRIQVVDEDGNPLLQEIRGEIRVELPPPEARIPRNVPLAVPLVIPFPDLPVVQRSGAYAVNILLDDRHVKTLPFASAHPPQQPT